MGKMVRVAVISLVVLLLIAVCPYVYEYVYDFVAQKQRESIMDCKIDTDCEIKHYNNGCFGGWSSCFNRDKTPMNNIGLPAVMCDFSATSCSCVNNKCKNNFDF